MLEQTAIGGRRPTLTTIDAANAAEVRRLAHCIADEFSPEASVALREFIANVREHCPVKAVDIVQLPGLLVAYDYGGGIQCGLSQKPRGEGGYGLRIMRSLGAEIRRWEEGTMFVMVV